MLFRSIIFMALIIAPSVGGPTLPLNLESSLPDNDMIKGLFQPNPIGYDDISAYHNDTGPIDVNSEIIASESSVVAEFDRTRTDGGGRAKQTDGADSSSNTDSSGSSNSDGGVGGNEADGFSGKRKLVRLL